MKKVIVGMSGGVDSSVAAYILKKNGYDVIGATSIMWDDDHVRDAAKVCDMLGIEHVIVDMRAAFKCEVIDYFIKEYQRARTPNPCNMCNRYVKWEALMRVARERGAEYIATGHYARIEQLDNGRYTVKNSATASKDQTYALCFLSQEQLAKTLMPLGDYTKEQVRKLAEELKLPVANKKDSQDICFIPDKDYAAFIEKETGSKKGFEEGLFLDTEGNVLGKHKGFSHYTYGQRRGLGVSARTRLCVLDIRPDTNEVILGCDDETRGDALWCVDINWMSRDAIEEPTKALVKIRYAHKGEYATLIPDKDMVKVQFDNPVRAITPGQPAVFYEGDRVMGAGIIK